MRLAVGATLHARVLLFDMDGTLVNSTAVIAGLWRHWAARHSLDPDAVLLASPGRRTIETVRMFVPHGIDAVAEANGLAAAAAETTQGLAAIPGASALLHSLPRTCWAVVTSADRFLARCWMRQVGLPVPNVLITAEDVPAGKPDPAGYLQALSRLGCDPANAIVFEDAPSGLAAGRAAGARVIAVASTLTPAELGGHEWLPDFSEVTCMASRDGSVALRVGEVTP
ncbi:MAG TPA: HAD-IA family hydrolase [Acetobacteraceae bacterium]